MIVHRPNKGRIRVLSHGLRPQMIANHRVDDGHPYLVSVVVQLNKSRRCGFSGHIILIEYAYCFRRDVDKVDPMLIWSVILFWFALVTTDDIVLPSCCLFHVALLCPHKQRLFTRLISSSSSTLYNVFDDAAVSHSEVK